MLRALMSMAFMLIVASALPAWSQPPASDMTPAPQAQAGQGSFLGLRQAVEQALKVHPLLQEADAALRAATAKKEQTKSLYFPQIYANADSAAGAARINGRFVTPAGGLIQPNLSQYTVGVIASQRLYDFGYTQNLVESSKLAERAQGEDINARRAFVVLTVERAYFNSLKRKRLVQIAEETVRERGIIKSQIESLYRQQLKSKLDLALVQVELTNAESLLVKARNDLKASFAELNRAMGVAGRDDYILEDLSVAVRHIRALDALIADSLSHPELKRAREQAASADARAQAMKKQYLPTVSAIASAGNFDTFDSSRTDVSTGGWWAAGATVSVPLFTGFLIENQVREATAQKTAADAGALNIEQALTQQVTNAYLDTISFTQQIKLAEEQVRTAQEALQLAKQRYKLGLGSVVEVTQSEVALTSAQTRLAESQYDYKIAEVTLAYTIGRGMDTYDENRTP
jgi:outer membrane protein